jgi:PEGA domain
MRPSWFATGLFIVGLTVAAWPVPALAQPAPPGPWTGSGEPGAIKFEVKPRQAEIYVDGYRAGIVDEFDGLFQRMRLRPGEHEIVLYLEGYRTVRQTIQLQDGGDVKIKYTMVPLAPGEANEPRPEPPPTPPASPQPTNVPGFFEPAPDQAPSPTASPEGFGAVTVRVQPADAEVWIDGQQWNGSEAQGPLVVQLAPGTHRVEIRKAGYLPYSTQVEVRARHATPINVSLPPQR